MSFDTGQGAVIADRGSGRAGAAPARLLPLLAVAAAVLALLWQGLFVQAHVHAPAPAWSGPAAARDAVPARLAARPHPDDAPAACPLCRELAQAGSYLLPADTATDVPPPPFGHPADGAFAVRAGQGLSHAWRSRGPPRRP